MAFGGANLALILAAYSVPIILASLAGGWIPLLVRPTHTRLQLGTSLVAGMMLGVGLLHLLPHAYHYLGSLDDTVAWSLVGFLVVFFIQRFFHFHHHDVPGEHLSECHHVHDASEVEEGHGHQHTAASHVHDHCCEEHSLAQQSARRLSWTGATLGLVLHSLFDGLAIAAAVQAELHDSPVLIAGLGTFLVVLLHKPFDALAVGTLLARGGHGVRFRHMINGLLAVSIPVGMSFFLVGELLHGVSPQVLGISLAFSSGTFLCIATSDLLPELQFHAHDRFKLSLALLMGLGISVGIGVFEHGVHDGHTPQATADSHAAPCP